MKSRYLPLLVGLAIVAIVVCNATSTAAAVIKNSISGANIASINRTVEISNVQERTIAGNITDRNLNILSINRDAIAGIIRINDLNRSLIAKPNISEISRIAVINRRIIGANLQNNRIIAAISEIAA